MTRSIWVVGESGLLGSKIRAVLVEQREHLFQLPWRIDWKSPVGLEIQIRQALREFASFSQGAEGWAIYWAAGVGSFAATHDELQPELLALRAMLDELALMRMVERPGAIAFASSAGAIYAGRSDESINEQSSVAPNTPYGFIKLEQEASLVEFGDRHRAIHVFIARISTMYGPRGPGAVNKGLLSHMARSVVLRKPLEVYVPFDTIRDYVHVDDVANVMLGYTQGESANVQIKIVASERPASISEIIGIFRRASRRPLVVNRINRLSQLYDNRISFRSCVRLPPFLPTSTALSIGIFQMLESERLALARGTA